MGNVCDGENEKGGELEMLDAIVVTSQSLPETAVSADKVKPEDRHEPQVPDSPSSNRKKKSNSTRKASLFVDLRMKGTQA